MRADTFTFKAEDQRELFVYRWLPDEGARKKAVVHVAHGMAEHAGRYARVAGALVEAGYAVYADDHRGHGRTAAPQAGGRPGAPSDGELGWMGPDGFRRSVQDLQQLLVFEKAENPGLPAVLFGHSMGSYFAQAFLVEAGASIRAAVLSGTGGKPSFIASLGRAVARLERARLGPKGKSPLLQALSFDEFNKAFRPNRTAFDWLSRDDAEVDKYVADPLCGFAVSTQLWVDLLDGLAAISRPERQAKIPRDLPIYVFSGSEDPVGEKTKSVQQLLAAYGRAGVTDVTHKFYPGARHETLNETNRDEVTRDLVAWLDSRLASAG
jgi:alpha-beta hydrolase superfamily lysophospholipase